MDEDKKLQMTPEETLDAPPAEAAEEKPAKRVHKKAAKPEEAALPVETGEAAADAAAAEKPAKPEKTEKPPKTAEQMEWEAARKAEFKQLVWAPWLRPVVALLAICLVTSLLLGLTNAVTAPIIEENTRLAAEEARTALLPEADGFEDVPLPEGVKNVSAIHRATNGAGYVVEAYGAGYGGRVPAMVAFDAAGTIIGVTFLENSETQGLGTKLVTEPWFAEQFSGMDAQPVALTGIDTLANATISSNAALTAVNAAIEAFNAVTGGTGGGADNLADAVQQLLPDETLEPIALSAAGVQTDAWHTSGGNYIIVGEAEGGYSTIVVAVAIDDAGVVLNLWVDTTGEHNAATLGSDAAYVQQFVGESLPVDVETVATLTITADAVNEAVDSALGALQQAKEAA